GLLVAVAEGRDPGREKKAARRKAAAGGSNLFEDVARRFVERYAKTNTRESSWRETERLLEKEVIPKWKGRAIDSITRSDVVELLDEIVDSDRPIMANRTLAVIRKLFNWSVGRGSLERSPCDKVKAP